MRPKKLVCYYEIGEYPITQQQIKFLVDRLYEFNENDSAVIVLPDSIKLDYLDAFSIKKFVKTTAMRLKLRFGKW